MRKTLMILLILLVIGISGCVEEQPTLEEEGVTAGQKNFIQPSHTLDEVDIEFIDGDLIIRNVDYCNRARGSSMNPAIFDGHYVCFRKLNDVSELEIGDTIHLRDYKGREYMHRVTAIYADHILVQGDNSDIIRRVEFDDEIYGVSIGVLYVEDR